MPPNSSRRLRNAQLCILLVMMASAGTSAKPPVSVTKSNPTPQKSPIELEKDLVADTQAAFDADIIETQQNQTTFNRTFSHKKPEEAGLAEAHAEAAKQLTSSAVAVAADAHRDMAEAKKYETSLPAFAQQLRQDALRKLGSARDLLGRANEVYKPSGAHTLAPPPSHPAIVGDACDKEACRILKQMARKSVTPGAPDVYEFDRERAVPILPALPGAGRDTIFRGKMQPFPKLDGDGSTLVLPHGQQFEPRELRDAIRDVDPQAAERPLFERCGTKACPSRPLVRMLGDPAKRDALRRIGGVALDATFDLLGNSGMSELRGGGSVSLIDQPVLISLGALASAADPWRDKWDHLPDAIRFPGNIGRIRGFVLSGDGQDVVLVANRAEVPDARIDIDTISIILRTIWRQGDVPAVSLDPRVDEIGGRQFSRIISVPGDFSVAAAMLDADYAMKVITMDADWAQPLDLIGLHRLAREFSGDPTGLSRFWLSPQPVRRDSLYRSATGRTVLFDSGVQVQTETMMVQNGQLVGTGARGGLQQATGDAFTAAYPKLETNSAVRPRSIFYRLHGIADLSILARGLRELAIDNPALQRTVSLPYMHLTGHNAVAPSYPGLSSRLQVGSKDFDVWGGAVMRAAPNALNAPSFDDHVGSDLERWVDKGGSRMVQTADLTLAVPLGTVAGTQASDEDVALLTASRSLEREDWQVAESAYASIIAKKPTLLAAYYGQAQSLIGGGHLSDAVLPLAKAMVLAPDDAPGVAMLADLSWQMDPDRTFQLLLPAERSQLSLQYALIALRELRQGKLNRAQLHVGWALRLDPDNGQAYLTRSFLSPATSRSREQDLALAIRSFRRSYSAHGPPALMELTSGLLIASKHHVLRGVLAASNGQTLTARTMLETAQHEAIDAEQLDSSSVEAKTTRLVATAYLARVVDPSSTMPSAVSAELSELAEKFPADTTVWMAQAQIYSLDRRWSEAKEAIERAIVLQPNAPLFYWTRGVIAVGARSCAAATEDFSTARRIAGQRSSALGFEQPPQCLS